MSVTILHPKQQYLFRPDQIDLIYDLLKAYLDETERSEEIALTQETLNLISNQI